MAYKNTSKYNSKTTKSWDLETKQKSRSISMREKSVDGFLDYNILDINCFFPTSFCDSISIRFQELEIW